MDWKRVVYQWPRQSKVGTFKIREANATGRNDYRESKKRHQLRDKIYYLFRSAV